MQTDLEESKAVRRLARIILKREIAGSKSTKHMNKMRTHRSNAFDDDKDYGHAKEYKKMELHRRASIRFNRIAKGHHPFKSLGEGLSLPHIKGKGIASILARKHDKIANKYAHSADGKKLGRHERATQRYARIAAGRTPFSKE